MIRMIKDDDTQAICEIYNHYIKNTMVTFEEQLVSAKEMAGRIHSVSSEYPWFVYEEAGAVIGYSYANRWKSRSAYRYSVESTVYLAPEVMGLGIGTALYEELLKALRKQNIHSAVGCIALPNPASVKLHEKLGFQKIAHLKEMGWKFDKWIDVGYWQLILKDSE
ncbi:MAG: N-acetyltransferase [Planctomycetes bacterium]|nr:N-acetyltransferase [Planctomycetota bacterium]